MIRILLVDDQVIIRQGLKALLETEPDFQIVGSADNGKTAIEQVEALRPDVVLIDILMPVMDGVTATRHICQRFPETKVLVLSGSDDDRHLAGVLRAGARGYLLKTTPAHDLANAIRSINKGYAQIGPGLFDKIPLKVPRSNSVQPDRVSPTPWQLSVVRQLKSFDPKALPELVRLAVELGTVAELLTQVNHQLQKNPTNLAALYLAGSLAHRNQGDRTLALQHLRLGFLEGIKQGLSRECLLLFYQEGAILQSAEAFTWLTQFDGFWNSKEGFSFLLQEAEQIFGKDSTYCRALLALRQIRAMRALSENCATLGPMVEALHQGFDRFNNILKVKAEKLS